MILVEKVSLRLAYHILHLCPLSNCFPNCLLREEHSLSFLEDLILSLQSAPETLLLLDAL